MLVDTAINKLQESIEDIFLIIDALEPNNITTEKLNNLNKQLRAAIDQTKQLKKWVNYPEELMENSCDKTNEIIEIC